MCAYTPVYDFRNRQLGKRAVRINLWLDGRQERKGSCLAISSGLILDVIDDQAVRRERAKSGHVLSRDLTQSFGFRRELRRRDPIEPDPGESTIQLFEERSH